MTVVGNKRSVQTARYGLNVPTSTHGTDPVALAGRVEELGFDFLSINDHLHGDRPTYETWTLLTWLAARTARIGLVTRVLGVPYRAPAVVAKMAESLDRLSDGRLTLGLGGGSSDEEFRAFGLGDFTPRQKVDGMHDAITIARGLWSGEPFSYEGRRYRTRAARLTPGAQRHIPIWLGTYGPRALAITGRQADGWIPSYGFVGASELVRMRGTMRAAAERAGRDPDAIMCVLNLEIRLDSTAAPTDDMVAGSTSSVLDQLGHLTALGFPNFNFIPAGSDVSDQIEVLAREILPELRSATP